jgi:hypothetical protein
MASDHPDSKKAAVKNAEEAAKALAVILPESETPHWLSLFLTYVDNYHKGRWEGVYFMKHFYKVLPQLLSHEWGLEENENFALDFDGVFELYRKESRLPELFDEIIELLNTIKNSGEIDSVNMMEALTKIIATLKCGKAGSYFSLDGAWAFLMNFANNYLWAELGKIPVLGTVFDALKKTIDDADKEMDKLHSAVQQELDRRVRQEVKLITQSTVALVTYGRQGYLLEDPRGTGTGTAIQA